MVIGYADNSMFDSIQDSVVSVKDGATKDWVGETNDMTDDIEDEDVDIDSDIEDEVSDDDNISDDEGYQDDIPVAIIMKPRKSHFTPMSKGTYDNMLEEESYI